MFLFLEIQTTNDNITPPPPQVFNKVLIPSLILRFAHFKNAYLS